MPLIRAQELPADRADRLIPHPIGVEWALADLTNPQADTRRRAAIALGQPGPGGGDERIHLAALARQLAVEQDGAVRESLFAVIGMIGGPAAAELLAPFLQQEDAGLRNGAVESLKRLGEAAVPVVDGLLQRADADLRLMAVAVIGGWSPRLATARLRALLAGEADVNVVGAALDVAVVAGDASLLPVLDLCGERFAGETFIAFAIGMARRDCATRPAEQPRSQRQARPGKPGRRGRVAS